MKSEDRLIRYLGAENEYVLKVALSSSLVKKAAKIQDYSPTAIEYLGNLLTASLLMEDSSKNERETLTLELRGEEASSKVLAIADSRGNAKGCVCNPSLSSPIEKGFLVVSKDQGMKAPYRTTMPLVTGDVENNLMYYYAGSEQLPTFFSLGVSLDEENHVEYAYGYMVQALPFARKEIQQKIVSNLESVPKKEEILSKRMSPEQIVSSLLRGLSQIETEEKPIRFHCSCSKKKGLEILTRAGKEEISSLMEKGEPIEVVCGSCGRKYVYQPEEAARLLKD